MNISHYIGELLYDYDCVIIPGFGGFITNYAAARIHPKQHLFHPPSKDILFNPQLTRNDGVLAGYIGRKENISYEEAMISIGKFLEEIFSEMDQQEAFVFERIGVIKRDAEGLYHFEPNREINFLAESYGLPAFTALPVTKKGSLRQSSKQSVLTLGIGEALKKAAVFMLPVTLATGMTLVYYNGYKNAASYRADIISSLKPLGEPIEEFITGKKEKETLPLSSAMDKYAGMVADTWSTGTYEPAHVSTIPEPVVESNDETSTGLPLQEQQSPEISLDERFVIMVGAFRIRENADKLLADLTHKGYHPQVIDETKNGLIRIGIESHANMEEAAEALRKIRAGEFPQAWILSR